MYSYISPKKVFTFQTVNEAIQTAYTSSSFIGGATFYVSQKASQFVSVKISKIFSVMNFPISYVVETTRNKPNLHNKVSWITPASGMALNTLAAHHLTLISPWYLKGVIYGVHRVGMRLGAFSFSGDSNSLANCFRRLLPKQPTPSNLTLIKDIKYKSDLASSVSLLVSAVALTFLFQNLILANCVAFSLAAFVKVVSERIFLNIENNRIIANEVEMNEFV